MEEKRTEIKHMKVKNIRGDIYNPGKFKQNLEILDPTAVTQ